LPILSLSSFAHFLPADPKLASSVTQAHPRAHELHHVNTSPDYRCPSSSIPCPDSKALSSHSTGLSPLSAYSTHHYNRLVVPIPFESES
jgi:hypothetical protein